MNFSGFIAWWLRRTIYPSKLPRLEKKLCGMLDWALALIFSKDLVQFITLRAPTVLHVEHGDHLDQPWMSRPPASTLAASGARCVVWGFWQ